MRLTLAALLLLAAAPARAQADGDSLSFETRALLAALSASHEAAEDFETALSPTDSLGARAARQLRQRALEGAVEAARAELMMETVAALRAEGGAETPLSNEEVELRGLLSTLQRYGDDLVELQACDEAAPPLNFATIRANAQPTFDRIYELVVLLGERVEGAGDDPEADPEVE